MEGFQCSKVVYYITLFRSITIFCGTDNISQNILMFTLNVENIFREYCQSHITLLWISTMICIRDIVTNE